MLIYLFLISLATRFAFLFFGHPSITHDEADYFINSYLLAKTGTDIFSKKFFLTSGILNSTSGVLVYLGSVIFLFLEKTVISARLPFAIINALSPVLLYLILEKLTKNKRLALLGFTVMNFSPWFSVLSAMSAFDSPTSMVFYLLAFYFLLDKGKNKLKYILFGIFSFLSFNSYMGIKTNFFFLSLLALNAHDFYLKNKIDGKKLLKNFAVSVGVFVVLFAAAYLSPSSSFFKERLKEKIIFFDKETVSKDVEYNRSVSTGQPVFIKLFHNKATSMAANALTRYFLVFDPYRLFVKGDPNPLYGNGYAGLFYLFDAVFLIVGLMTALKILQKKPLPLYVFFVLFLVTPIPNALMIDSPNISVRAMPILIPYSFVIAIGLYWVAEKIFKNRRLATIVPFTLYLLSFIMFFTLFQTTIKITSSDQWHYSEKELADKIEDTKNNHKSIYVFNGEPKETALLYDFYKIKDAEKIRNSLSPINGEYRIDNIVFKSGCPKGTLNKNNLYIIKRYSCDMDKIGRELVTPVTKKPYLNAIDKSGTVYWQIIVLDNNL